ncbi:MAG: hypothetical protein ACKUBY_04315 [Candidatus Moraniibacteriota bacterium]|jgi:hypothetical protein
MSITKSFLRTLQQGSAEYVVAHAKFQKKRGRNIAATFCGIRNPKKALIAARAVMSEPISKLVDGDVSITGLNKADVLAALYNTARPQGMGFMHYDPTPMSREVAEKLLEQGKYFDYLLGRVMKTQIEGDEISVHGFEMDNGVGTVQQVIDELRENGDVNSAVIQRMHVGSTVDAIGEIAQW